eukprot:6301733-Amphidinium_carterae.1
MSEALRTILVRLFALVLSVYFEDFAIVDCSGSAAGATYVVETVFTILGIVFFRKPSKRKAFAETMGILGVE